MTQANRREFLIQELLSEQREFWDVKIPKTQQEQEKLLRTLFNLRMPRPVSEDFLQVQNEYLQQEIKMAGITDVCTLQPIQTGIYLWRGDITTLRCDGIVNAANSKMLGCFVPCHSCIDNAIHTYAGVQLRNICAEIMGERGCDAAPGEAVITPACNLPCKYILHTVGPIVRDRLTEKDRGLLSSCYRSCLTLAEKNGLHSLAFCCISTGEFHFPNDRAAKIAVDTVREYKIQTNSSIEVIFNVFKDTDYKIYRELLRSNKEVKK